VYKHYQDRRTDLRRESDIGLPQQRLAADRRSGKPRRITDG